MRTTLDQQAMDDRAAAIIRCVRDVQAGTTYAAAALHNSRGQVFKITEVQVRRACRVLGIAKPSTDPNVMICGLTEDELREIHRLMQAGMSTDRLASSGRCPEHLVEVVSKVVKLLDAMDAGMRPRAAAQHAGVSWRRAQCWAANWERVWELRPKRRNRHEH